MELNYKYKNNGKETVLFLHGWGVDSNSFSFLSQKLSADYDILLVDFRGHGKSKPLKYVYTVYDYAEEIFKLLKCLKLNNITIVAHSFGVRVAILLSTIFDLKIKNIVVMGGAGIKPRFNIFTKICIYKYKFKKVLNQKFNCHFKLNNLGSDDYINLDSITRQSFVKIVNFDEKKYIKLITCPVLLLWGKNDKSTPLYMAKKFKKYIQNSRLVIFKKCGHFCFNNYPLLIYYEIIKFLDSTI